ncbi:MAG: cytochrome c [Anaerolineae bacterium]|nr:cytochrome c [Anaerolineae bacterium]
MNSSIEDKRQRVIACRGLLLPVLVIVLLFTACGSPASGKMLSLPTYTLADSRADQTPTLGIGQAAAANPADTQNRGVLPPSADAMNGQQLFNTFQPAAGIACATCHRVDSEARLVGPGLLNVGKRAGTRVRGMSAIEYLRQSIVSPSAYVVEGYTDLMPKNWGKVFSEKQIDDLIAYLLTLKEDSA